MVIKPTVGRVLWYWPSAPRHHDEQPCTAQICYVHSDRLVNIIAHDHDGEPIRKREVLLVQAGDPQPRYGSYCEWMPYQVGQAKKHEDSAEDATFCPGCHLSRNCCECGDTAKAD